MIGLHADRRDAVAPPQHRIFRPVLDMADLTERDHLSVAVDQRQVVEAAEVRRLAEIAARDQRDGADVLAPA
jgi:hypothetical protein